MATTHIVAEKNGRRFVIIVKYRKGKLKEEERVTISGLARTGCIPSLVSVYGDINKDEWRVIWRGLKG